MITITYKDAQGKWVEDGSEHLLLDFAKAHAKKSGYPEYKAWDGDRLAAHLFNKECSPVEHFHAVKAEEKKPEPVTLEELADEFDGVEVEEIEEEEPDQTDDE